jgi:hypothetical protein
MGGLGFAVKTGKHANAEGNLSKLGRFDKPFIEPEFMPPLPLDFLILHTLFFVVIVLFFLSYTKSLDLLTLMRKEQPEITRTFYVYFFPILWPLAYYSVPKSDRSKYSNKVRRLSRLCMILMFLEILLIAAFLIYCIVF